MPAVIFRRSRAAAEGTLGGAEPEEQWNAKRTAARTKSDTSAAKARRIRFRRLRLAGNRIESRWLRRVPVHLQGNPESGDGDQGVWQIHEYVDAQADRLQMGEEIGNHVDRVP